MVSFLVHSRSILGCILSTITSKANHSDDDSVTFSALSVAGDDSVTYLTVLASDDNPITFSAVSANATNSFEALV